MSEITRGVIGMPFKLAMSSEMSRRQFHVCAQEVFVEKERLEVQVATLKADPNSWQSGYDEGRKMGTKTALAECDQLKAENEALRDAAAVAAMRIKELDLLFGRYLLAMRAAVIEDEHGKTETAGMDWIFNSLAGPGQLPPEGETDAQAYFDREIVAVDKGMEEVMAFHDQRHAAKSKESSHG
jgi:hypothetical protein